VQLAIDDYGTGYSGLMRLLELPITALKLDCGLTRRLPYAFGQGHLFERPTPESGLHRVLGPASTSLASLTAPQPFAAAVQSDATRWHSVQLYRTDEELVEEVCDFLAPSMSSDEGVVLIATAQHLALARRR
jgi:hypothetical protein